MCFRRGIGAGHVLSLRVPGAFCPSGYRVRSVPPGAGHVPSLRVPGAGNRTFFVKLPAFLAVFAGNRTFFVELPSPKEYRLGEIAKKQYLCPHEKDWRFSLTLFEWDDMAFLLYHFNTVCPIFWAQTDSYKGRVTVLTATRRTLDHPRNTVYTYVSALAENDKTTPYTFSAK